MDKLAKLMQDIAILWDKYHPMYLRGMLSTLGLALAATAKIGRASCRERVCLYV